MSVLLIQVFDVNMNTTAAWRTHGRVGAHPEGVLPNGLSTIQDQVSGGKGAVTGVGHSSFRTLVLGLFSPDEKD